MAAVLLLRDRLVLTETAFVEMVVWSLPAPAIGSNHSFKYRLALVSRGDCVFRYDNEAGKGDHKHIGQRQVSYRFRTLEQLQRDFWDDVEAWRASNEDRNA